MGAYIEAFSRTPAGQPRRNPHLSAIAIVRSLTATWLTTSHPGNLPPPCLDKGARRDPLGRNPNFSSCRTSPALECTATSTWVWSSHDTTGKDPTSHLPDPSFPGSHSTHMATPDRPVSLSRQTGTFREDPHEMHPLGPCISMENLEGVPEQMGEHHSPRGTSHEVVVGHPEHPEGSYHIPLPSSGLPLHRREQASMGALPGHQAPEHRVHPLDPGGEDSSSSQESPPSLPGPADKVVTQINKQGGTLSWSLMEPNLDLMTWAMSNQVTLRARHIPGPLNSGQTSYPGRTTSVDRGIHLSQGDQRNKEDLGSTPDRPLCASFQPKLPGSVPPLPDPSAGVVDAISMSWENLAGYADPPTPLSGKFWRNPGLQESDLLGHTLLAKPSRVPKPARPSHRSTKKSAAKLVTHLLMQP